jgi:hypothetical protein
MATVMMWLLEGGAKLVFDLLRELELLGVLTS